MASYIIACTISLVVGFLAAAFIGGATLSEKTKVAYEAGYRDGKLSMESNLEGILE